MKELRIRAMIGKETARSEKNPERYSMLLDGKPMEVAFREIEYAVERISDNLLNDIITALKRLDGNKLEKIELN